MKEELKQALKILQSLKKGALDFEKRLHQSYGRESPYDMGKVKAYDQAIDLITRLVLKGE
jgi:hypothetical protein